MTTTSAAIESGGDEVGQRADAHDLERIDLLGDPHGAELRRELAPHLRRQAECRDERGDLARVGVRRQVPRQRREPDDLQALVPLEPDGDADERGNDEDDEDGARGNRHQAAAEGHVGDQPHHLVAVPDRACRGWTRTILNAEDHEAARARRAAPDIRVATEGRRADSSPPGSVGICLRSSAATVTGSSAARARGRSRSG